MLTTNNQILFLIEVHDQKYCKNYLLHLINQVTPCVRNTRWTFHVFSKGILFSCALNICLNLVASFIKRKREKPFGDLKLQKLFEHLDVPPKARNIWSRNALSFSIVFLYKCQETNQVLIWQDIYTKKACIILAFKMI